MIIGMSSCQTKTEVYLIERTWIVEEAHYKDENLMPHLLTFTFRFYQSKKCQIPYTDKGDGFIDNKEFAGKWSIIESDKLNIESARGYINGEFKFCFEKDKKGQEYLIISSEELYIKARRGKFGGNTPMPFSCKNNV